MSSRTSAFQTSRVFSTQVVQSLAQRDASAAAKRISPVLETLDFDTEISLGQWFDFAFEQIAVNYRNEYFYKNSLVSKIIFGRHSPKTASALLELPAGGSIADLAVLNGTSTVYEVKTDFDSFARLRGQLTDYGKCFDHVNLVTSAERLESALSVAPSWVGVLGLRRNGVFTVGRESVGGGERLDVAVAFEMLRQDEALRLLHEYQGYEPDVPKGDLWSRSKEVFLEIPREAAYAGLVKQLKSRGLTGSALATSSSYPKSLRALAYGSKLNRVEMARLVRRLSMKATNKELFSFSRD